MSTTPLIAKEPIAIIGTGCRFPGSASSPSKLWKLLAEPYDLRRKLPDSRFNPEGVYHPDGKHHGTSNVKHSYILEEDHRHFDAQFFGIKPSEASSMDPQQRHLLEVIYEGLEAAGQRIENLKGSSTAVYVGLMYGEYGEMLVRHPEDLPTYTATGAARSIMANRVSYFFDWHGPSMTIDTACSSSLVALHHAVQALRLGECPIAIAAGSNLCLGPESYIAESKLQMLSPNGRSRMWDADADGYARGDGVAAVVLKLLKDAIADGDDIECIIRETAVNQDGRTRGITMPNSQAQTELIRTAYSRAGLDLANPADRPQYFEAHGTGTPTGDPLEAAAIHQAFFGDDNASKHSKLYVGSIKSIIGHTEGTAGLAGIIKASLAIQNKRIPPNLWFHKLNPEIEPYYTHLYVPTEPIDWPGDATTVRRASVNSFGFGGTNAHAIVEGLPPATYDRSNVTKQHGLPFVPLTFSAHSEVALVGTLSQYAQHIKDGYALDARSLAHTLNNHRSQFEYRYAFGIDQSQTLLENLESHIELLQKKETQISNKVVKPGSARILGIFTGQGAQYGGMIRELYQKSPKIRQEIEEFERTLGQLPESLRPTWSLKEELLKTGKDSRVSEAALSQPLSTVVQIILVDLLRAARIQFSAVVGHSSGEIVASYAAGFIQAADAILIAYLRGLVTSTATGKPGGMIAVETSYEDATEICNLPNFEGRLCIAAVNSSSSLTLSGDLDAVEGAKDILEDEEKFARMLKVDKAYHSHHMLQFSEAYSDCLRQQAITIQKPPPGSPLWVSSVDVESFREAPPDLSSGYWIRNLTQPVFFHQAITKAILDLELVDLAVEVGPHPALKAPASQSLQESLEDVVPYTGMLRRGQDAVKAFGDGIAQVWTTLGEASMMNLSNLEEYLSQSESTGILKDLPTYPWVHERLFWHEARESKIRRSRNQQPNLLLGHRSTEDPGQQFRWRNILTPREIPWLSDHRIQGQRLFPAAGYVAVAMEAAAAMSQGNEMFLIELQDIVLGAALNFDDDDSRVEVLCTLTDLDHVKQQETSILTAKFHYFSAPCNDAGPMLLNAEGRLVIHYGSGSKDTLPPSADIGPGFTDVDYDRFYEYLAPLGYGYTGPFRGLSSLKRKLGAVSGIVSQPIDEEQPSIVHPAMLDCTIQTMLLAYSWPGDGRLWSLHIPTRIGNVLLNPKLAPANQASPIHHYTFDTVLIDDENRGVTGNISVHAVGGQTLLRMEGLHAIPLEGAKPETDRKLFSKVVWDVATPDAAKVVGDERASPDDYRRAELLERVSHFYLRRLDNAFPANDPIRSDGPWVGMLGFAHQTVEAVRQGSHICARADWADDDEKTIEAEFHKFPENIDLKIARIIGKNIISVVRGESNMLEHLRAGDTLDDYYANAMGIHYTEYVARLARQLSFKHPNLNFLEIGAGTGAATKSIFREIGKSYKSYTFTDISSAFFEAAQTTFSEHLTKMRFNTLDIEKDLEEQGYKPNSYDVVVASLVVHATRNLKDTLTRIRQLLRPGGYLLLLEVTNIDLARLSFVFGSLPGWWLGEEPHRRYNPCVGTQEWGDLLLRSGFSGLDTVTSEKDSLPFPTSAILSQAVDDQVSFLREPLCSGDELASSRISPNVLLIIGGRSKHASKLSTVIKSLTAQYFVRGTFEVDSLEQVQPTNFDPSGAIVLVMADLDRNVFEGLDEKRFQGLKILFNNAQRIFWVTSEARDNNPFHLMSVGFGRSMQMEMPHVQTQYVDLTDVNAGASLMLAEILLRFDALTSTETFQSEQVLWPLEPEVCVNSDGQLIHRIMHDAEKNHRYNSLRRDIALEVQVDAKNPVEVSRQSGGYRLLPQRAQNSSSQSQNQAILVETLFSTILAVQLDESSSLHVCLGTTAGHGRPVACLTETIATRLSVPDELVVGCRDISPRFLGTLSTALIAGAIVQTSSDCIVVVEPEEELAFAIRAHASSKPISLLFLTTDVNKVQPHHHYIHPSVGISELDLVIPRGCRRVLLTGKAEHAESRIKTWAQSRQVHVAGLMPVAQSYHSPRSSLSFLQNLLQSSIPIAEKLQGGNFEVLTLQDLTKFSPSQTRGMTIPIVDLRPTKAPVTIEPVDKYALLRGDRTYWLFGLSKSLGLSLCGWMIDHGAKHIVISSRSPAVDKSALNALRSKGADVKIIPCNIVDKQSVVAAHRLIQASMPPIAGVANGTMVLRDTMLEDMTVEEMNAAIHPKVIGSINLNDLFLNTQLDFFIFFSSAIGITGNVGQCNYAVANMFMHGLAAKRRKNGLAASVIVIGVILGVGYVTRETSQSLQDSLAKSGHNWLSERDLQILFAEAILDGSASSPYQSEIVVGLKTIRQDDDHFPPWAPNPRFSHLILQSEDGGATNSTSNDNVPLRTKFLEATSVQEIYEVFRDELVNHVIAMLRMDDSVPKAQFLQYTAGHLGIDSLNAVDLRTWFMKEAKIDVPVLRILGGATLGDLLDFSLDLLSTDVAPAKSPDFQPSSKPTETSARPPAKAKPLKLTTVVPPTPAPVSKTTSTTANISSSNITQQEKPQPTPKGLLFKPADSIEIAKTPPHPASSSTSDSSLGDSFSIINQLSPSSVSSKKSSQFVSVSKEKPDAQEILRSENLSRGQSRFWFLQSYVEDPTTFNITCLFKLQGKIDIAKFEQAVASIGRRHEALRTSISDHIHGKLEQHVLKEANLFLESQTWFEEDDVQLKFDELKEYSYDLAQGKLTRIVLLSPQLSTLEHYLLIGYHHVNMDGISLEIILKELEDLYSGRSLNTTPLQFADYAAYEDQKLFNGEWNQHIDYWKGQLNQAPEVFPVLPFGEAGMRQAIKTYGHVKSRLVIDSDTKKFIQRVCKTYKVSPYHFYLATYLTLLARWAEVPEVCIGSSYANRHDSNRQTSVGLYLNPVALRLPYNGKNTFVSALETARKFSNEASMHSEVPFDVLLDNLKIERNPAFSPIFQTFINYRPRTDESRPFGSSSTLIGVEYESGKTPYDVMLDVFDGQQNGSRIEVSLQKYLYSQDAVETLAKSYLALVKSFARNPMQLLDNAPLHGDRDLRDVAELGKGQNLELTWGPTVIHHLEDLCSEHSSRLAIRHRIEDTLTFGDMFDRIDRIYEALSDAAVTIGSAVGVHMQASADWICSALAIIKYGSIYVPLDFRQGKSRLKAIIKECQPAAILVDGQTLAPAEEMTSDWKIKSINLTNIVGSAKMPTPIRSRASDQAAFYYTSGSTGIPKGIPLTNEGICNHMEGMSDRLKVTPDDVMLQQTAFSFDFSLWQILIALTNAASIVIVPDHLRRDAVGIVDLMVKNKVTMTATTPSEYSSWLRYGASKLRDSSWTRILCGGEPMPHGLLEDLWALGKIDLRLEHLYGPTEITFIATTCPLDYSKEYTIIPIGRPIANYTIVILGKDGQALPAGVLGEIAIGSVGASTQYLNKPEESRQKFRSSMPALEKIGIPPVRFHLTGDEGWLSSEGLLFICGRIAGDTQMKLRGQRLDLLDIEQAIVHASSGSILEANVSANRDARGADFLVAQVVLRQGSPEIDLPELAAALPLQQFMRPSVIFAVDKFPVTDHGKRDRRALASVNVSQLPRPKTKNVGLTPDQQRIFSIWKDIIPEETIGVHDITPDSDFFAVGGTSLTVLELQKRIQKDLGARLEVAALFESSSLRQMASLMEEQTQLGISEEKQIDWDKETQLDIPEDQFRNAKSMRDWIASSNNVDGLVVILTGATGFLGKALLRALIATTEVVKVHCLAIRQVEKLSEFFDEPTLQIHTGDLTSPRLGLPEEVAREIFSESHVIIHNGADVSFLKTYASLRQSNVQSTRELIKLSLTYIDGGHDFHFVSTAGVLGFSGEREFPSNTASGFYPPTDGSFGYSASKWASERILERASDAYGLSVSIYRPTNITGDQTPELDLVHNIVKFSQILKVVPDPKGIWDGFINFVSLDTCTDDILSSILHVAYGREPGIRYLHVTGPEDIPVDGLKSHLERNDGARTWYKQVSLAQWVAKAERAGLKPLTGAYLKKLATEKQQVYLTRVLKEKGASDRAPDMERTSSWNVFNGWRRT